MERWAELAVAAREGRLDELRARTSGSTDADDRLVLSWLALRDGSPEAAVQALVPWGDGAWRARAARLLSTGGCAGLPPPAGYALAPEALRAAVGLAAAQPDDRLAAQVLARAGRTPEAMAALRRACAAAPWDAALVLRTARLLDGYGDAEGALELLRAAPDDPELAELRAELASQLGGPVDALVAWEEVAPDDSFGHASRRARAGDLAGASAFAGRPGGEVAAAWLALWRGEPEEAERRLGAAEGAEAEVARGVIELLRGRFDAALARLSVAQVGRPPWAGRDVIDAWRAEALLRRGEVAEAGRVAEAALQAGEGPTAGTSLTRLAARFAGTPPAVSLPPWAWRTVWGRMSPLGAREVGDRAADLLEETRRLLERLGGNRSAVCTVREGDLLRHVPLAPVPRALARRAQLLLRTRPVAEVLARLEALSEAFPEDETPWTYRGEVLLWAGRYAEAEPCFQAALTRNPRATWGWIGSGAARMLQGDLEGAQARWRTGTDDVRVMGPTLFIYRGEAAWRAGRLADARRDLDAALRDRPKRVSTHVVAALIAADQGDPEPAARLEQRLLRAAPGPVARAEGDDPVERLRWLLDAMRGNRSSALPAVQADGAWWFLTPLG